VLKEAIKVMKFVEARPLSSRLFAVLCEEIEADNKSLLLHSKVRWLSRGKFLERLVELKEVRRFLQDSGSPLYQHFLDKKWLAHLSDIFDKRNGLNSSFEGSNATVFQIFDKVSAFMKKTMLWKIFVKVTP
jgi:hypothetical protein